MLSSATAAVESYSNDGIQLKSPCVSNGVSFQMGLTLMAFLLMILERRTASTEFSEYEAEASKSRGQKLPMYKKSIRFSYYLNLQGKNSSLAR